MSNRPATGYEWTATEVQTLQGFSVGAGNKHHDEDQPTFLVVRYQDERSSELCKEIEAMSFSSGGIVINSQAAISRGLSSEYHTHLFHSNCRCRLVLKPKATPDVTSSEDFILATQDSSLAVTEQQRAANVLGQDFLDGYTSFDYQKSVSRAIDSNSSKGARL